MSASEKKKISEARGDAAFGRLSLRLILRTFRSLGSYKFLVLFSSLLVCFVAWSDMQIIHMVSGIIKAGVPREGSIVRLLIPLVIIALLNRGLGSAQWIMNTYAANRAMANLRKQFFGKLQALSKNFFDNHKTGWLVARSTGDLAILQDFMTFALMMTAFLFTLMVSALLRIASIAPVLLLPAVVIIPLVVYISARYKRRMTTLQRSAREQNSRLVANMTESVRGVRVVQAFSRQQRNLEDFNTLNLLSHDTEIEVAKLDAVFLPSLDFIGVLNITVVVAFAAWLIKHPAFPLLGAPLTTADIIAYVMYMNAILWPSRMIVEIYSMSIRTMAAAERIYEIIDLQPEVRDPAHPIDVTDISGEIEFDRVGFRYNATGDWVIRDFNLRIAPGENIALVGRTGAGKTTLASLAARFYDVEEGAIKIDGRDIRQYRQGDLHRAMGIVLQQGYLFSGSVLDNLRLRRPDMSRDEVIALARELGTHDIIKALPRGYDTEINEGGESLSLGQRQVISITRALLANPDILIMDEPTSSLDVHTESVIQRAIDRLIKNRTSIVIAHRLSTVRQADRIVVIDEGQIVECGSHQELMDAGGRYCDLVRTGERLG